MSTHTPTAYSSVKKCEKKSTFKVKRKCLISSYDDIITLEPLTTHQMTWKSSVKKQRNSLIS